MVSSDRENIINEKERPAAGSGGGGQDSLTRYLQQIGRIPLLQDEEQQQLCREIEDTLSRMRQCIFRFAFAADEYLRLLNECLNGTAALADYFQPSYFSGDSSSNPARPGSLSPELRSRLEQLFADISSLRRQKERARADGDREGAAAAQTELAERFETFAVNNDTVSEWIRVIDDYLQMAGGDAAAGDAPEPPSPARRTLPEERFGIPLAEAAAISAELAVLRKQVEKQRHRMLEANLRLVVNIARRYQLCPLPLNDLIQEGNLGLLRALERFDFKMGNKFSTYASWWIRRNIARAIGEQSRIIRMPGHMISAISAMNCAEQRFAQSYGREPEDHELAAMMEMPTARISAIRKMARQPLSLQAPVSDADGSNSLEDMIADKDSDSPADAYSRALLFERIHQMLNTLPERDRQIIILRFGLCGQPAMGLQEISRKINLSGERIRQIEQKVIKTLRSPSYLKYIDNCMH